MTDDAHSLKIAVWQAASAPADVEVNLAALDSAASAASSRGAELLITPEMYVTGYNIGDRVRQLAAERPLERVRGIARRHRIGIVAGGPEAPGDPGLADAPVFNAAWLIDEQGEVLARHHKIQLFGELDRALFVAGDAPATIADFHGHRIALLICFDVEFPETVRAAARAGADLIAVPTAQMEPFAFVNEHLIRVRAWENGVFVAYANQHGPDGAFTYVGRSVVADPLGRHLAAAPAEGDALLVAELDPRCRAAALTQSPYLAEVRSSLLAPGPLP
ncbi:carbon-nitrogen hydrolase family protein [Leucobacter sp. wl10]|uniref:carbon-nitrogen hydrolase family protein n=1 Tax=Leucobacter sp. wl10 TaxID=2304677 RepID=UPI000E5A8DC6|nr:carbon-nitrogen hydrolase family protein [Leucobacter sp. wl10]RGE23328.1 nitrilase [Leucobacter sp. wl10]